MSGHSKWANIRVKKTAQDAKRGKIFTRHAKLIEIAAREGGSTSAPSKELGRATSSVQPFSPRLRTAIENARADNVPKEIIERAIAKGGGKLKDGTETVEVTYEAFGPGGTAFIIECLTDNRNRCLANVKHILHRHEGRLAETGSVSWMFARKGQALIPEQTVEVDEATEKRVAALLWALEEEQDVAEVWTNALTLHSPP